MQPASDDSGPHPDTTAATPRTDYPLWEAALELIADRAQTIKPAETRVLLELTRRQLRTGAAVTASSRDIAAWCKLARSKTIPAIDSLTKRGILTTRQGAANRTSWYEVNIPRPIRIGGPQRGPLDGAGWSPKGLELAPFRDRTGPQEGPPPTENTALTAAPHRVEISTALPSELDRVLKSKVSDFDPNLLSYTRRFIHSYFTKMGVDDNRRRFLDTGEAPHPPDDKLIAQLLAVADPPRLFACLDNLVGEQGHEPHNYPWFIAVTLQRIHGITWQQTKQARAALRDVKRKRQPTPPEQTGLNFAADLAARAVAGVGKLR